MLVALTRAWIARKGTSRLGIAMVYERARWDVALQTAGDSWRLPNNHRAFYARLIMEQEPDLSDAYVVHQQRVQASFGPDDTPPGA